MSNWLSINIIAIASTIKATTYVYFCLFFPLSSPPQTTAKCPPHTFHHGLTPSLISPPSRTPIFGWLMCPPIKRRPLWSWPHPPLSYFLSNISTAERTSSRHLPTSRRGHTPSPITPPIDNSKIWLVVVSPAC